jgi:hypothetical protein
MSDAVKSDLCGKPTGQEQERQCTRKRDDPPYRRGAITKAIESARFSEIAIRQKYIGTAVGVDGPPCQRKLPITRLFRQFAGSLPDCR